MPADVVIAGGGMVGASLALALRQLDLEVVLVEAAPLATGSSPSFDERTTALSNGSRRILEGLGVWPLVTHEATPIRKIHVSDRGRFAFARIDAAELNIGQLGFVVPNRVLGAALWQCLETARVALRAPAKATGYEAAAEDCTVRIDTGTRTEETLRARLLVAADGAHSAVRHAAGVGASTWDYDQTAITANVTTQRFHDHVAYERFTPSGPIALLPLEGRMGLVWTLAPADAAAVLALPDDEFLRQLQAAFGMRLGRFLSIGKRHSYALSLLRADEQTADRLVILGNAAQGLHPIAGQGLNLGLRDVASLAEILADALAMRSDIAFDAGAPQLLERYREWRHDDRRRIVAFTDGLVRVFRQPLAPVRWLRDIALLAFDLSPHAKGALAQLSLGAAGRIPRLARGAALVTRLTASGQSRKR